MKPYLVKIPFLSSLLMAGTVLLVSCSEEEKLTSHNTATASQSVGLSYLPDINPCYQGVSFVNGHIRFNTTADFQATLDCLKNKTNDMETDFLNDYGYLSDTLLNDEEENIGYNDEEVYQAFEDHFGYISLRKNLNDELDIWLNTLPLDTNQGMSPDHIVGDKEMQSILNLEGVFSLADTLYYIQPNGDYYRVLNGDYALLDAIMQGTWVGPDPNVEEYVDYDQSSGKTSGTGCKARAHDGSRWSYNSSGSYGMRYKSGFYTIVPRTVHYAETRSFKRRGSRYDRYRTQISATSHGDNRERDHLTVDPCSNPPKWYSDTESGRAKSQRANETYWFNQRIWQCRDHKGIHTFSKVGTKNTSPNW